MLEAYQYLGHTWEKVPTKFFKAVCLIHHKDMAGPGGGSESIDEPHIHTQHGAVTIKPGEWVALDSAGFFYPIAKDVMEASYEEWIEENKDAKA